jgi:hypothetical protein
MNAPIALGGFCISASHGVDDHKNHQAEKSRELWSRQGGSGRTAGN